MPAGQIAERVGELAFEHRSIGIGSIVPAADHAAALIALERMNPGKRLTDGPDRLPEPAL